MGSLADYTTVAINGWKHRVVEVINQRKNMKMKRKHVKHGLRKHPLYRFWANMKQRCYNPNGPKYHLWGGKGVRVCEEWRNDFIAFRDWAMANGWQQGLTIDRINSDGDYCPENCRWVDSATQAANRSVRKNTKTGVLGVRPHRKSYQWFVHAWGMRILHGGYKTIQAAAQARNEFIQVMELPHKLSCVDVLD